MMAMNLGRRFGLSVSARLSSAGSRPLRVSGARQFHRFVDSEYLGTSPAGWLLWMGMGAAYLRWLGIGDFWKDCQRLKKSYKIEISRLEQEIAKRKATIEHVRGENEDLKKSLAKMRNVDTKYDKKA